MAAIISRPNNANTQRSQNTAVEYVGSGTGTIDEGALIIGFLNSGTVDATINGYVLPAGAGKTYGFTGKQYGEIAVIATGTTVEIVAIY